MDRYERILALHRSLKSARYPVAIKGLMEEMACSRATLYRDIAFLRDALGAPIESEGEGSIRYDGKEAERTSCSTAPGRACFPARWHRSRAGSNRCWPSRRAASAGRWSACA